MCFGDVNSSLWLVKVAPRAFGAVFDLDLDYVLESDDLAKAFDFTFWWQDLDVHPLNCQRVVFFWLLMSW